jgi:hypothetical protein
VKFLLSISFIFSLITTWAQVDSVAIEFNPMGGVYTENVTVTLRTESNSKIYYTLDGSMPSSGSKSYSKPIAINKVGVIRAITYIGGKKTNIITQSYFCDRTYSLPIISITSNPENLWDYARGIYVKGCCADTTEPYLGANFWKSWERTCNVEMYDVNGEPCFNQQAGMSLFGGYSRALPQKSLALIARKKYGKSKFEYKLFDERKHKKYKSFILRNSGGDFLRTHLRDAFMTQLMAPTGMAIQAYEPAIVFLNGKYWGIQNIREKINEHYLAQNFDVDKDNVDILRQNGVKRHGSSKNYKYLLNYLRTHDLSKDANVARLAEFMYIDDFIRYNIAETYSDNRDAGGNIRYFRELTDSAKWRWVFYDLDLGLANNTYTGYKRNTIKKFTNVNHEAWPDPAWSTFIIRKLLTNKKLQHLYINTLCDFFATVLKPELASYKLDAMASEIEPEMQYHLDRWGSSMKNWRFHLNIIDTFIKQRPRYMRQHLKEKFNLGEEVSVKIIKPKLNNCKIKFNSLDVTSNLRGIYYENIPITITVTPKHDYELIGWKGRSEKTASLTIIPTGDLVLEPILRPKQQSIYFDSLIINEISSYQSKTDSTDDWIELFNHSNRSINLKDFRFTKKKYSKGFIVKNEYTLKPNQYVILAKNKTNFLLTHSVDSNLVIGDFNFGLSSKGTHIKLYDFNGFIVDSLKYKKTKHKVDTLISLSLIHIDSNRYNKSNWKTESPTPLAKSEHYVTYLFNEEQKAIWKKRLYIGSGSFFFICLGGILWFRYSKKRKVSK